ncbi:hypothetical protein SLEP1_g50181 [Rubroshorea leprosula]|uniref:F-box protein n=1 Tax=Rubroshorea leprosula TaxID=152421 RepID=A0AAV5LZ56_9ROSI|nr:hypothetical protein SLEP1_g50181 [Rubroshorea leprosula]
MSDHVVQSDNDTDRTAIKSMHNYQISWISHWKHTSCKPSIRAHNDLSLCSGFKDDGANIKQHVLRCGPEKATHITKFTQGFREVSEAGTVNIMDNTLKMSAMKSEKGSLYSQPFSVFNASPIQECAVAINNDRRISSPSEMVNHQLCPKSGQDTVTPGRSKWPHPEMACNNPLRPRGILWDPEQLVKSHNFLEKDNLAVSAFQLDVGSSSKIAPNKFENGEAQMQSFVCQQQKNDQSSPFAASKEHVTDAKFCSYSTFWIHEKKTDTMMELRKFGTSLSRLNDSSPWLHETSTSHSQLPAFLNKQNQKGEDDCSIRLLPSRGSHPEVMESVKGYDEYYSMPRIPCSVRDVETMRMSTTIDSMEELPRGLPKFSQTTRKFLITKKTDVNLSSLGQVFRDSKLSSQLKEKMYCDFLSLSPSSSFQGQQEVNLQPLWSSTDSEGRENVGNVKTSSVCLKNESSAETDAMELDFFQKSHLSGVPLRPPNQKTKVAKKSSTSQTTIASAREEIAERMENTTTELPDINQEPFSVQVMASLADDRKTSPSRTLSLDAEHRISHAERPTNAISIACPDGPLGAEPGSRWVKRLRLSSSDSLAHGSKSSKIGEASSQEKVNEIFSKILKHSITSSDPTIGRCHGKPQIDLDQAVVLLKNGDSSSTDSGVKSQHITLSHSWIQRWAKSKAASPKMKSEVIESCEPQGSKAAVDEFQKKQFPSIAAMALMGKAISSFHPCEFRRRGALIVWNT